MKITHTLFAACSIASLALISANPAHAKAAGGSGDGPNSSEGAIEEIIVTAQKREQNIQDVPIAISAFSGELLAAIHPR